MNTSNKLNRPVTWAGAALALVAITAFAMPTQATAVVQSAFTMVSEHLCVRFCGCHQHHHCHEWCDGYQHYHCPGHH